MPYREQMSSVDTAWLRMDRPSNLMMICGVLIFREPADYRRLRATIEQRFLTFPRFRQRPVEMPGVAFWEEDESFDIERHLHRVGLPGDAGEVELQALVSDLIATPLDASKPMWQFHLVENYRGGSAVVVRIHHCYADGIALVQVLLSMTDADRLGPPQEAPARRRRKPRGGEGIDLVLGPLQGLLRTAVKWGAVLVEKGGEVLAEPSKVVELAEQGSALTSEIVKLVAMDQDSPTRFKGHPGVAKRVAWAHPISLADVKAVGKALGCSVNDVLLSSVAGALRSYLVSHGDSVDGVMLRATVPVNLRPLEKAHRLGNRFGLVFLDLPIGIENPIARLYAVRANMAALKGSYQPVLALGLLAALGAGPKLLQDQILNVLSRNATAVMTNVPGPQAPLYLAGAKLDTFMFWVPQSGDIGMGVSILSYDGRVQFGLLTDRGLCPDPESVIARFVPEFEKLLLTALMAPWEGTLAPAVAEAIVARSSRGAYASGRHGGPTARRERRKEPGGRERIPKASVARRRKSGRA